MNNITQHFITAYFGEQLKENDKMHSYLNVIEIADNGIYAVEKDGTPKSENTNLTGFKKRTANGLTLEHLGKAD
ncbi:MAG: hypothetical protein K9G33_01755 [Sneathiella sp.]|nr:hypothetical protein [Sneathiella sp.]